MTRATAGLLLLLLAGAACGAAPGASPSGELVYGRQCYGCHAIEPGRNTPAGPTLHAIVGRPVASVPGFNYSPAMRRLAAREPRWTRDALDRFLAGPDTMVPGTEMGLPGLADAGERRALIDWLARQGDNR